MKRLIKEAIKTIQEHPEKFIYIDSKGKTVHLEDAAKKGTAVKPILVKTKAVEKLKEEGLDLSRADIRSDLYKLLDLLDVNGHHLQKDFSPKVYSKDEILDKWMDYTMDDENANAEEFAEEHHVGYQTLAKWIKEVKPR
ncbi:hypothetical protein DN752_00520 [Echinicola strongylocentroti]|uniref:Uncharacterized protein n=1 Tax=Echinicola strongylocentroti TaxID=1795355 RepID=A0A2Z4ID19_9BACT|nr:hypothetical protein [Echinicola strongylocentroti]AWW28739.1 hypothetical protein DN752_00520 [Echinicola strongylocentroti]